MLWGSSTLSEFHTSLTKVLTLWHCVKVKQHYLNSSITQQNFKKPLHYSQTEQNILIWPQSVTFVHIFFTALSSMSSESGRSVTSGRSNVSQKSGVSNSSSWFSIGSLSNFQASRIIDAKTINRPPRVSV